MSGDPTEKKTEKPKSRKFAFLDIADDELLISYAGEPEPHRVVFRTSETKGKIPVNSAIFNKLDTITKSSKNDTGFSYFKNNSYTLGLTKHGNMVIYVKTRLNIFPKEFLRSLRDDFKFEENEIRGLIERLEFVELEIANKISDPKNNLRNAKVEYEIEGLIRKLVAFTDESYDGLELELKGDPETSSNLEFLLRDKLNAVLYFSELTKIVKKLSEIQKELKESIEFIKNGIVFQIDVLLHERLVISERKTEKTENEENKK